MIPNSIRANFPTLEKLRADQPLEFGRLTDDERTQALRGVVAWLEDLERRLAKRASDEQKAQNGERPIPEP